LCAELRCGLRGASDRPEVLRDAGYSVTSVPRVLQGRFWRSGRIVRLGTPGGPGGFRMIPRFSQNRCRGGGRTFLPERHFSLPRLPAHPPAPPERV